jgi:transcriptional regulator with XRE-family HTH domain
VKLSLVALLDAGWRLWSYNGHKARHLLSQAVIAVKTPLGELIRDQAHEQGMSMRAVARRAGLDIERLRFYTVAGRWQATTWPKPEILQAIADGLRIPLADVQRAAEASVGSAPRPPTHLSVDQEAAVCSALTHSRLMTLA